MKQIFAAMSLVLVLASCGEAVEATSQTEPPPPAVPGTPVADNDSFLSARPSTWTDPDTGCQYLVFFGGYTGNSPAVTPRMQWSGYHSETRQMCGKE